MKVLISGFGGFMGREVQKAAERGVCHMEIAGGVDPFYAGSSTLPVAKSFQEAEKLFPQGTVDCIIDFSNHAVVGELLDYAEKMGIPTVIATTGHTPEEQARIKAASSKIPLFVSANMSLGIALLVKMAKLTAAALPDAEIEIVETHHDRKLDAPSGTALMLAKEIQSVRPEAELHCGRSGQGKRQPQEIGIHAIRMGNVVGTHEVLIGTQTQTITLKHEAHDRGLFAEGAAAAAEFLVKQPAGLYDMHSLLEEERKETV